MSHFDGGVPAGISPALVEQTILLPTDDVSAAGEAMRQRDDIAAVILEGSGASWGMVPLPRNFLAELRAATKRHGVVMILDEVITGFRWARRGTQARFGMHTRAGLAGARKRASASRRTCACSPRSSPAACRAARWRATPRSWISSMPKLRR